jgi:hypothetical protein
MTTLITLVAAAVAIAAAARSTWSPCGVSMLASITPLAERGRGHRYRTTALWFVAGAVAGGASLGLVLAALARGVAAAGLSTAALAALAGAAAVLGAVSDAGVGGFSLPVHHRQVNERWLDQFRPWVYGAGFGWQIGSGVATYIRTAGVYLVAVLAVLSGSWWCALALGVLFGLVRGLAVLLGRRITSPAALAAFHVRLTRLAPVSVAAMVCVQAAAALLFAWVVGPWAAAAATLAGVTLAGVTLAARWAARRRGRPVSVERSEPVTGRRLPAAPL